jgi:hypothetical protein
MVSEVHYMGVFGISDTNAAIWQRNEGDSTFLLEIRAEMVRWHIFLCIFRKFLCKYKNAWPPSKNAQKNLIFWFGGS